LSLLIVFNLYQEGDRGLRRSSIKNELSARKELEVYGFNGKKNQGRKDSQGETTSAVKIGKKGAILCSEGKTLRMTFIDRRKGANQP